MLNIISIINIMLSTSRVIYFLTLLNILPVSTTSSPLSYISSNRVVRTLYFARCAGLLKNKDKRIGESSKFCETATLSKPKLQLLKRGGPIDKYTDYNIDELSKMIVQEASSMLPDSVKIEEIAQTLRRKHLNSSTNHTDLRSFIENHSWRVIYPKKDNITIVWKISKTDKQGFYCGVPDRVKKSIIQTINPSFPDISKLCITQMQKIDVKSNRVEDSIVEWSNKHKKLMFLSRIILNILSHFSKHTYNKDEISEDHMDYEIKAHIQTKNSGVYTNPVLTNSYHIPYKPPYRTNKKTEFQYFTITDNNLMFADENIVIMENTWTRYPNDDIYKLPVMVCTKFGDGSRKFDVNTLKSGRNINV